MQISFSMGNVSYIIQRKRCGAGSPPVGLYNGPGLFYNSGYNGRKCTQHQYGFREFGGGVCGRGGFGGLKRGFRF